MIKIVFLLALIASQTRAFLPRLQTLQGLHTSRAMFRNWMEASTKTYSSTFEYLYRMYVFHTNRLLVEEHNKTGASFKMALNGFADLTSEEFMQRYTNSKIIPNSPQSQSRIHADEGSSEADHYKVKLDRSVNWVDKGVLNPIQDQGGCGSCYSFSSIAAVEAAYAIANGGNLKKFSEQYVVNCGSETDLNLNGCDGGIIGDVYEFYKKFGVYEENRFPYLGFVDKCDKDAKPFLKISGYVANSQQTVEQLLGELMKGPVTLAIEVTPSYQLYSTGLINIKAPCGFFLNHGVTAVGYDLDAAIPYVLIRNSWGTIWGEQGYFKHALGDITTMGQCAFANKYSGRPLL